MEATTGIDFPPNQTFKGDEDPQRVFTGSMHVMDATGDTKVIWDAKAKDEVDVAKDTFKKLKAKGYLAYTVSKDGSKGEVISKFDPKAEKIIMSPPMAGG